MNWAAGGRGGGGQNRGEFSFEKLIFPLPGILRYRLLALAGDICNWSGLIQLDLVPQTTGENKAGLAKTSLVSGLLTVSALTAVFSSQEGYLISNLCFHTQTINGMEADFLINSSINRSNCGLLGLLWVNLSIRLR